MGFEIFPQSVTLYPGDTQYLTFRATPPPALWSTFTNCTIDSSANVVRTSSGTFGASIEQRVHAGIGAVEWTLDSNMLPTGAGYIELQLFGVGTIATTHAYVVKIQPTVTTVRQETPTTIDTITRTVAAGDVYKLEIAGQMFRLYINGTLETEYDAGSLTETPFRANAFGFGAMASATPKISAPVFIGNWEIFPEDTANCAWTVTGGTVDDSSDTWRPLYTAGDSPGVYTQICTAEESEATAVTYQTATSTVIIPPLSILGETSLTLQPGEVVTFKTNYDNAQTRLVTWAVVSGGGSFSNGAYTAPTAPATPIVKATSGDQFAIIRITVPAVMTIETSGGEDVTAATLGEVLTLSTNIASGTINWTASVGTLSSSTGSTVTWTAPNQSQLVGLIKATNGTYTVSVEIPTLKEFPYRASRPAKWDNRKTVLVSRAEDRSRAARVKDANNESFEAFELSFINRSLAEVDAVKAFWDDHHPQKRFIFTDHHRNSTRKVVYFDSDITNQGEATCSTTYSLRVIEG